MQTLPFKTTEQKYNYSRTRAAQRQGRSNNEKRRINISVNGALWDKLDDMGIENKSSFIEEFIKKEVENYYKEMACANE